VISAVLNGIRGDCADL